MDHFRNVYTNKAAAYHALIAAEDADGNLLPALQAITPLAGARVLDLGSGSGRIPLLLQGLDCTIVASDLHYAMLLEQRQQRSLVNASWPLVQADGRQTPFASGWADVVTAGWAFGHLVGWYPDAWQQHAGRAIAEMQRTVKPGGTLIIMETLGTGVLQPAPPHAGLAAYYAWLENEHGFVRTTVATDYDFGSVERAVELCSFFFGEEMAERVRTNGWQRVPEWTGVWSKHIP
ncbi:MAG TPA: class I SAM-dependent methyltransferase [Anaerolineales bacterium]|nr:class I SAM-dependent methyltransferase [Anaerolineales bacterium]HRQ93139.1 class I SAM-dependent methyltransferase [Anaerolineales bacterium]